MNKKKSNLIAFAVLAPGLLLGRLLNAASHGVAQTSQAPYPSMAPLAQYLMPDRNDEIQLSKSAAPAAVSDHAEVLVLTAHGYESAVHGSNGFVCLVERAWMSPFDSPEFWNWKLRGPICFNPPSARSVLPLTYKRTDMVLAGLSKAQIIAGLKDAEDKKQLPAIEAGAMAFMMSRQQYLGDKFGQAIPHLMLYSAKSEGADWGEDLPNSPVMLNTQFEGSAEPLRGYIVPVSNWSDGTPAASGAHKH